MNFEASKFCGFWLILLVFVINLELAVCYKCIYERVDLDDYNCIINPDLNSIEEKHLNGKTDNNVRGIVFNGTMNGVSHLTQSELTPLCQRFQNLIKIHIHGVKSVDENLFQQCTNLKIVWILKHSEIERIKENLFFDDHQLTTITLSYNNLIALPEDVFVNQKKLEKLDLSQNQISCFPPNIFKSLMLLEYLDLSGNKIKSLNPKWFENLQLLTDLFLYDNKIQDLPKHVFVSLTKLISLYLHDNQLTTIHSDSFGTHKNLWYIHLRNNKIKSIDENFIDNKVVKWLDLNGNVCSNNGNNDNCFKNYQPRREQSGSVELCLNPAETTTTTKYVRPTKITTITNFVQPTEPTTTTIKCGTRVNFAKGLIHGGSFVDRGEYPWNVALLKRTGNLFCGGTLVSNRLIITAAHCMKGKDDIYEFGTEDFTVMLGVHNYKKSDELGRISAEVKSINVHKHWSTNAPNYDGDIAILELANEVQFNNYIRPICLADEDSEVAEASHGTVVGFGFNENGTLSDIANKLDISISSYHSCTLNNSDHQIFASARTFCGGPADGRGVCTGDSGGGVYVLHNEAFYLRGLVSNSLFNSITMECDTHKQAIFTDVTQYYEWINRALKKKN